MDEQNQNEQPKVRRAKSGGAEEPRPGVTGAGNAGQAEQEAPENLSEKLSRAGEEASRATEKGGVRQVESVLPWPFQASQHALDEWTHFFGRAVERNSRAAGDLGACDSVASVLRWQRDLLQSNAEDWLQTSFAAVGVSVRKASHAEAAQ